MTKKYIIFLFSTLLCIFLFSPLPFVEAKTPPITYKTEVKVKLLPTNTFSLKLNGKYELVNLDNNAVITNGNTFTVSQKGGMVNIKVGENNISSTKGFDVNEIQQEESNDIEVSSINTVKGTTPVKYRGAMEIRSGQAAPNLFNRLDMENYLKGVVPSEMPASWHMEALKAQTVAARSYAYTQVKRNNGKGYLEMTISSQVYGGKTSEHPRSNDAIQQTSEIYATYNNVPIDAVFHSSSGGHTENSENVWSSAVPYIKAVPDPYDKENGNTHYGWSVNTTADSIKSKFNLNSSQTLLSLEVTKRGPSTAVQQMEAVVYDEQTKSTSSVSLLPKYGATPDRLRSLFGVSLKSIKFSVTADSHQKIQLADGTIQSTDYLKGVKIMDATGTEIPILEQNLSVKLPNSTTLISTTPKTFTFKGDGWGHLLGMSQWGARGMAERGYIYDAIIKYYYTGVEVKKIN